jgi:hypothetical protein
MEECRRPDAAVDRTDCKQFGFEVSVSGSAAGDGSREGDGKRQRRLPYYIFDAPGKGAGDEGLSSSGSNSISTPGSTAWDADPLAAALLSGTSLIPPFFQGRVPVHPNATELEGQTDEIVLQQPAPKPQVHGA